MDKNTNTTTETKTLTELIQKKKSNNSKEIIIKESLNDLWEMEIFKENTTEENEFLKEKTCETINLQAKASLSLGKIFTEIADKYSNNKNGTYGKWLKLMGFNERTALRHRGRFSLYNRTTNMDSKSLIAGLSVKDLEKILQDEEIFLEYFDNGLTKEELHNLLDSKEINSAKNKKIDFNEEIIEIDLKVKFVDITNVLNEKIDVLEEKEKLKIEDYLTKIEKILLKDNKENKE
ncbi:MAG: hypothetical protein ACK5NU_05675 [Fusobacterium ulcerans]|uniref:hypothetical protein n=1 Tax=Fusobacterium ulcerans TaxID=861 RepID=UPI003A89F9CA